MELQKTTTVQADPWQSLKAFTAARIALGRTGHAMPLDAILKIKLAHAHARDAVYSQLDLVQLNEDLQPLFDKILTVQSTVKSRSQYLKRPDKGRVLDKASVNKLTALHSNQRGISIVVADGLSAKAINKHALPVLQYLVPLLRQQQHFIQPLCIASQARVAMGDKIGMLMNASLTLMLIGERPGLTSPESMGAYITYNPTTGLTDESRNCISNIRPEGLGYKQAAEKICYLIQQCFRLKTSGTAVKDDELILPENIS